MSTHKAITDGDTVVNYSHVCLKPGELEIAAIHILRFEDCKITEFWDVVQVISTDSLNENGMF